MWDKIDDLENIYTIYLIILQLKTILFIEKLKIFILFNVTFRIELIVL